MFRLKMFFTLKMPGIKHGKALTGEIEGYRYFYRKVYIWKIAILTIPGSM